MDTTRDIAGALWGGCKQVISGVYKNLYKPLSPPRSKKRPTPQDTPSTPPKRLKLDPDEERPQVTIGCYVKAAESGIHKEAHATGSSSVHEVKPDRKVDRPHNNISHLKRVLDADFNVMDGSPSRIEEGVTKVGLTLVDHEENTDRKKVGNKSPGKKKDPLVKQPLRRSRRLSGLHGTT